MNNLIRCFFFSGFLILLGESSSVANIKKNIEEFIDNGGTSQNHPLRLDDEGYIRETKVSLVWKGMFEDETVAIKITDQESSYSNEMHVFNALNAIENSNIEVHGIPRVFFGGTFTNSYYVIGLTLFDETLDDRMKQQKRQKKNISELSILLIFKRAVEILEYLNEKKVVHNDIKPANIFLRGSEVFLGDFNLATVNDASSQGHTAWFASSKFYLNQTRHAMDDLESLVYSLWYVGGVQWDKPSLFSLRRPEGMTLAECKINGTAKAKVTEKSKHFKDPHVQEAFKLCTFEMLEEKHAPDYRLLVNILTSAIKKIHGEYGTPRFEWLEDDGSIV